jgi:4-hydroxymandelate oxidase
MTTHLINLFEYEQGARDRLPEAEYDAIAGGSTDELTLRYNREAFETTLLRPRVLTGVESPDLKTTVLGHEIAFPVIAGPAGYHARAHPEGELATVRGAGRVGTLVVLSSASSHPLEDVAKEATGPIWFQQYIYRERSLTLDMIGRAEAAGFSAIVLTLDIAVRSKRERNIRQGYSNPRPPNYAGVELPERSDWAVSEAPTGVSALIDRRATWSDVAWVASQTELPIVVKAVVTAEDARLAADNGAKAIVVSNHGGRQLDTSVSSIEALDDVAQAVGGRVELYLDSGIRRGTDVVKALALGARAVLIGRPIFWGLAVAGEDGVADVLTILRDELRIDLALCGVSSVTNVPGELVSRRTGPLARPPAI